ncbi:MAG: hypothetical protein PHS73_03990 [Candidatus Peribacteraceae bacterium]|nr:hypothetical protein [Candidatus Peribacteraceae bacterium]
MNLVENFDGRPSAEEARSLMDRAEAICGRINGIRLVRRMNAAIAFNVDGSPQALDLLRRQLAENDIISSYAPSGDIFRGATQQ